MDITPVFEILSNHYSEFINNFETSFLKYFNDYDNKKIIKEVTLKILFEEKLSKDEIDKVLSYKKKKAKNEDAEKVVKIKSSS